MRHIPFIHQLCSHPTQRPISTYIHNCSTYFFHVVYTLWLETLNCYHLRMRSSRTTYFKVKLHFKVIDRIHKWRLTNCSFVFMLIILTSLVSTNKIQKNFCFKVRLVKMISKFMNTVYFVLYVVRIGRRYSEYCH